MCTKSKSSGNGEMNEGVIWFNVNSVNLKFKVLTIAFQRQILSILNINGGVEHPPL